MNRTSIEKNKRAVFCDFDGTITVEETFVGMLKRFAEAEYKSIEERVVSRQLTLREGVRRLVESIPSNRYPEVLDYIRDKEIRPGLGEFLEFLDAEGVPFVVVSGGLLGLVSTRLESLAEHIEAVYAADVDTRGKYLKVVSEFEGDVELVDKTRIMSRYDFDESVAIGDGISDLNMALHSSVVFARDNLAKHLERRGKLYKAWNDFRDVRESLARYWEDGDR